MRMDTHSWKSLCRQWARAAQTQRLHHRRRRGAQIYQIGGSLQEHMEKIQRYIVKASQCCNIITEIKHTLYALYAHCWILRTTLWSIASRQDNFVCILCINYNWHLLVMPANPNSILNRAYPPTTHTHCSGKAIFAKMHCGSERGKVLNLWNTVKHREIYLALICLISIVWTALTRAWRQQRFVHMKKKSCTTGLNFK